MIEDRRPEQVRLEPHRVTKPIQLLAAWLVGLTAVNASFLTAAIIMPEPAWLRVILVLAAVLNVPVFLISNFVLQTRFRPEMQEDVYYSTYLSSRLTNKDDADGNEIAAIRSELFETTNRLLAGVEAVQQQLVTIASSSATESRISTTRELRVAADAVLVQQIDATRAMLETTKKESTWAQYSVHVNDLIPGYTTVAAQLAEAAVSVTDTFGSSSSVPVRPGVFVLSFGSDVAAENLQYLIGLLAPQGLQAVAYAEESIHRRRIYIGSYGYHQKSFARLTPELKRSLLATDLTSDKAVGLIQAASKPSLRNMEAALAKLTPDEVEAVTLNLGLRDGGPVGLDIVAKMIKKTPSKTMALLTSAYRKLDEQILSEFAAA